MLVCLWRMVLRSTAVTVAVVRRCKRVMRIWMIMVMMTMVMIHCMHSNNNSSNNVAVIVRVGIIVLAVAVTLVVSRIIMWRSIRSAVKRTIPRSFIWGMMLIAMDGSNAIRPHHSHKHKHKHSHKQHEFGISISISINIMVILLQRPITVKMMILRMVSAPYRRIHNSNNNSGEVQRGIMCTKRICSFRSSRDLRFKWSGRRC
mmetsp:Transcript_13083/g.19929  ORF Transcript_13083/g.19929 Transcript_13083/m.19929 type:complete len:203 (-) Transcript_13083:363-971(-)